MLRPRITYPGGSSREYEHDGLMRVTRILANDPGGNPLLDYTYEYDPAGNIERKTTEHGTYTYDYDAASRLTGTNNPTLEDEHYTYDAVGNRVTASNATGTIAHNQNNELNVYGDLHYDYDANGNLTEITLDTQRVFRYVYTTENRLVKVENGVGTVMAEYDYDPFGRRLWKDVGGARTYFFYSDEGLIAEYDASGNEIKTYGWQPDSTWGTNPLWLKQDGEYYFYQNDHLGTPQKLVATNGAVVWSVHYTAFGEADMQVETIVNNLRFPGQYYDAESGLHYNFQRYYEPKIGRYVKIDPIGGGSDETNNYGYAQNNPLMFEDAKGLFSLPYVPHSDRWLGDIEVYNAMNAAIFRKKLLAMCPKTPEGVTLHPAEGKQQCCPAACEAQAHIIVNGYMEHVRQVQLIEFEEYGDVIGGTSGNNRRKRVPENPVFNAVRFYLNFLGIWDWPEENPEEGRPYTGGGRICEEWVKIAEMHVKSKTIEESYVKNGALCFRGAGVYKTKIKESWSPELSSMGYHAWALIYGPEKEELSHTADGDDVVMLDPWPSGGFQVIPNSLFPTNYDYHIGLGNYGWTGKWWWEKH